MAASDGTLVLGVLNGDRQAFAELYDRRARLVRALCFDVTRDVESAADLTQEIFMRAYHKLSTLEDPQKFGPWLVGITRRVCREWQRGKLRDRHHWVGLADRAVARPHPAEATDELRQLRTAIAELPEQERFALHAFYLQERDVEASRQMLGLSRSGFYHVLARARQRLSRLLAGEGGSRERAR